MTEAGSSLYGIESGTPSDLQSGHPGQSVNSTHDGALSDLGGVTRPRRAFPTDDERRRDDERLRRFDMSTPHTGAGNRTSPPDRSRGRDSLPLLGSWLTVPEACNNEGPPHPDVARDASGPRLVDWRSRLYTSAFVEPVGEAKPRRR